MLQPGEFGSGYFGVSTNVSEEKEKAGENVAAGVAENEHAEIEGDAGKDQMKASINAEPSESDPLLAPTTASDSKGCSSVFSDIARLLAVPVMLPLLFMTLCGSFSLTAIEVIYPLFLERAWGASPSQIGAVFGVLNCSYAVFEGIGGYLSDKWGRRIPLVVFGQLGFGVAVFFLAYSCSFSISMGLAVCSCFSSGALF